VCAVSGCVDDGPGGSPLQLEGYARLDAEEFGPPASLTFEPDGVVVAWPGVTLHLNLPAPGFASLADAGAVLCTPACEPLEGTLFVAEAGETYQAEDGDEWRLAFYVEAPSFTAAVRARRPD
jgi:hypothetical protein